MIVVNDQLEYHLQTWDDDSVAEDDDINGEESQRAKAGSNEPADSQNSQGAVFPKSTTLMRNLMTDLDRTSIELLLTGVLLGVLLAKIETFLLMRAILALTLLVLLDTLQKWRKLRQQHTRRVLKQNAAKILAAIGSPSPLEGDSFRISQQTVEFLEAFQSFLRQLDHGIDRLHCATSLSLGLGIWSPAVDRVELCSNKPLTLSATKHLVGKLLGRIMNEMDEAEHELPGIITLSWIKASKRHLLDTILPNFVISSNSTKTLTELRNQIENDTIYLRSLFQLRSRWNSKNRSDDDDDTLDRLGRHLRASEICLWRHHAEGIAEAGVYLSELEQLWENVDQLIQQIKGKNKMVRDSVVSDLLGEEEKAGNNPRPHPTSFEDPGEGKSLAVKDKKGTEPSMVDKTLIFSGKGSRYRPQRPAAPLEDIPFNPMAQTLMLHELKGRLSTLELAEEVNVTEVQEDGAENGVENEAEGAQRKELVSLESPTSKPRSGLGLVLTNNILMELQQTISNPTANANVNDRDGYEFVGE